MVHRIGDILSPSPLPTCCILGNIPPLCIRDVCFLGVGVGTVMRNRAGPGNMDREGDSHGRALQEGDQQQRGMRGMSAEGPCTGAAESLVAAGVQGLT